MTKLKRWVDNVGADIVDGFVFLGVWAFFCLLLRPGIAIINIIAEIVYVFRDLVCFPFEFYREMGKAEEKYGD